MADNVAITAGTGTDIATDDCGAAGHAQIVKLGIATDGSATPIPADSSGLLVKSGTAANMLVTEASAAAILTSTQLIDDVVYVDDTATHATGTSKGVLLMGAATPTDSAVSANDIGALAMTVDRKLHVAVMDALPAGSAALGSVTVTAQVPGTGTTSLGKAEDAAHSSGDTGVMVLGVRRASATDLSAGNTDGDYEPFQLDASGSLRVHVESTSAGSTTDTEDGTVADGQSSVALVITLPYTWDGDNFTRAGCTIFKTLDLDESEEQIKATAGVLYGGFFYNAAATIRYLKFYNDTAANVIVGTTVPVMTLPVPATTGGNLQVPPQGINFSAAMTAAVTTGFADNDTGAPSANDFFLTAYYK